MNVLNQSQEKIKIDLKKIQSSIYKTIHTFENYINLQSIISQINLDYQSTITFLDNLENAIAFIKLNT